MVRTSDHPVEQSLRILYARPSLLTGPRTRDRIAALHTIALQGNPYDIGRICHLPFDRSEGVARAACNTIGSLMETVRPHEWAQIERALREMHLRKGNLAGLNRSDNPGVEHVLGVWTMNHDGQIREAALRQLADRPEPGAIPYLLRRAADWVRPIRDLARGLVRARLNGLYAPALIRNEPLIEWLGKVRRADLTDLRQEILAFLRSAPARPHVITPLDDPNDRTRLFCFTLLAPEFGAQPDLARKAAADKSVRVRSWLAGGSAGIQPGGRASVLAALLYDKCALVRAAALSAVPAQLVDSFLARIIRERASNDR
jgi:hypothetical protein